MGLIPIWGPLISLSLPFSLPWSVFSDSLSHSYPSLRLSSSQVWRCLSTEKRHSSDLGHTIELQKFSYVFFFFFERKPSMEFSSIQLWHSTAKRRWHTNSVKSPKWFDRKIQWKKGKGRGTSTCLRREWCGTQFSAIRWVHCRRVFWCI